MEWVTGDRKPDIRHQLPLYDASDQPTGTYADLTTATDVYFQMRRPDDKRLTVNALAIIDDAPNGIVKYEWGENDLSVPGDYLVQWKVIWASGKPQTSDEYPITVRRR